MCVGFGRRFSYALCANASGRDQRDRWRGVTGSQAPHEIDQRPPNDHQYRHCRGDAVRLAATQRSYGRGRLRPGKPPLSAPHTAGTLPAAASLARHGPRCGTGQRQQHESVLVVSHAFGLANQGEPPSPRRVNSSFKFSRQPGRRLHRRAGDQLCVLRSPSQRLVLSWAAVLPATKRTRQSSGRTRTASCTCTDTCTSTRQRGGKR
jgi:hypothetical protein